MNVDQCKALGLIPYAVYGGRVESFKVREHAPETYSDPVLLKVLDQLIAERDHAVARIETLTVELDALKAQIAAGEPFDADELDQLATWIETSLFTPEPDDVFRKRLLELIPLAYSIARECVKFASGKGLDEIACQFQLKRELKWHTQMDARSREQVEGRTEVKLVMTPEQMASIHDGRVRERSVPRFDNTGEWVDQFAGVVKQCNTCARDKSLCPFHVSGPMYGCENWRTE